MRFERTCSSQKGTVLGMEGPRRESTVAGKAGRPFFIATVLSTSLNGESSHKPQRDRDREGSSPQVKYVQFTLGDTDFLGNLPAQERHHRAQEMGPGTDWTGRDPPPPVSLQPFLLCRGAK